MKQRERENATENLWMIIKCVDMSHNNASDKSHTVHSKKKSIIAWNFSRIHREIWGKNDVNNEKKKWNDTQRTHTHTHEFARKNGECAINVTVFTSHFVWIERFVGNCSCRICVAVFWCCYSCLLVRSSSFAHFSRSVTMCVIWRYESIVFFLLPKLENEIFQSLWIDHIFLYVNACVRV